MKLEPESKKELGRIAGGTAICTAAMWVVFAALHTVGWARFDSSVILGSLVGALVAIGNFAGICLVVQKIIDEQDEKRQSKITAFLQRADAAAGCLGGGGHRGPLLPGLCQHPAAVFPSDHHLLPANNGQVQAAENAAGACGHLGGR